MFHILFYLTFINSFISQYYLLSHGSLFLSRDFAWRMFVILKIRASFWSIFAMQTIEVIGCYLFVFDFLNVGLHGQRFRPKDNRQIVVLTSHILVTSTRKTVYLEAYQLLWHRRFDPQELEFLVSFPTMLIFWWSQDCSHFW